MGIGCLVYVGGGGSVEELGGDLGVAVSVIPRRGDTHILILVLVQAYSEVLALIWRVALFFS